MVFSMFVDLLSVYMSEFKFILKWCEWWFSCVIRCVFAEFKVCVLIVIYVLLFFFK